jgi:heme-degrading monooxygenase HmoA
MITIDKDNKLVTLINIFTVEPAKQQQLVDLLIHATETSMRHLPGFISANIHRSLDGTKVANYAQWRSVEDFKPCRRIPPPSHTWSRQPLLPSSSRVCMKLSILSLRRQTSNQATQRTAGRSVF